MRKWILILSAIYDAYMVFCGKCARVASVVRRDEQLYQPTSPTIKRRRSISCVFTVCLLGSIGSSFANGVVS